MSHAIASAGVVRSHDSASKSHAQSIRLLKPTSDLKRQLAASGRRDVISRRSRILCQARQTKEPQAIAIAAPRNLPARVQQSVLTPLTIVPIALGAGGAWAFGYGPEGIAAGAAIGGALRFLLAPLLQQTVPFTLRQHTLLLPVPIELTMGDTIFKQQLAGFQQQGKLLKESHSDYKLINSIAQRVIGAVEKQNGGGFQDHVGKFKWEVVVVDEKVPNAFVLPGGKIVVFTGLIKLMDRQEDLMAAVIGHEVAHALARHSSEKLSLGLLVTLALNAGIALLQVANRRNQNQNRFESRGAFPDPRMRAMRGGYRQQSPFLNPQILSIFTNIFLQMPFSRRAEAEADLIGLKLMALAGYDPERAPETFKRLAVAETNRPGGAAGKALALNCTHPRSASRVQLLEEELQMMREHGDVALNQVMHDIPYWML